MSILEAILLGVIQGLTEFLPVSSSGHIELGKALFDIEVKESLMLTVVLHLATALSTIVVYRKVIWNLILSLFRFKWDEDTSYVTKILASAVPVGLVGVFFEEEVESFFTGNILLVGMMLLITGLLLLFTNYAKTRKNDKLTYGNVMIIGVAQAIAIMPGISRSGATIGTGLLLGLKKEKVAEFSFLMVLIPILGASFLKLLEFFKQSEPSTLAPSILALSFAAAFFTGLVACTMMINIVKRGKLIYFAYYCFAVAAIAIAAALFI